MFTVTNRDFNHEATDGDRNEHTHYEWGMMEDFLRHKDHRVRQAHHDGSWDEHIADH